MIDKNIGDLFKGFFKKNKKENIVESNDSINITKTSQIDFLDNSKKNIGDIVDEIDLETEDEKQGEIKQKKKQIEKDVTNQLKESLKKQLKIFTPKTKAMLSNGFLIISLLIASYICYYSVIPTLTKIEIYKSDTVKVIKDLTVVQSNLQLLDESTKDAFEYRRLNDLLEQAVPLTDKYEDNILVILNLLKDSVTKYASQTKYLNKLSIKPAVKVKDMEYFKVNGYTLLGIQYGFSVTGFESYKYIKDFLTTIDDRLKIFHIPSIKIVKTINKETNIAEYGVQISMFSYYKVPKIEEKDY